MRYALVLVATVALGIVPTTSPSMDARSESHGRDSVEVTGRRVAIIPEGSSTTPARSRQPTAEVPSGTADTEQEPCIPRVRNFDGVDQPGHVCPDADGTLIWVPDTDADTGDPATAQLPPLVVTSEDVQTLLVNAGTINVQPDRSWVLVNAETIVHTDATEHILTTQVLGIAVDVRATPAQFTWDFGDGSEPITRTEPGAPWPDHTTAHRYQSTGDFAVTLRTHWDAHFRVQGASTWRPVTGTPVTVATSEPFEAVTATPRLTR